MNELLSATTTETFDLLQDPDFQTVLAYAKRVAAVRETQLLDVPDLRCGLLLSVENASLSNELMLNPPAMIVYSGELASAGYAPEKINADVLSVAERPWPLTPALRRCLNRARRTSFESFVALLEAAKADAPPKPIASLRSDEHYGHILRSTHAVADRFDLKELTPEAFLAGTVLARRHGLLDTRPTVRRKVDVFASEVARYLDHQRWLIDDLKPWAEEMSRPEHATLTALVECVAESDDPLLQIIDETLKIGVSFAQRERTAYHEAGHAVLMLALSPDASLIGVTIEPEGDSLGLTRFDGALMQRGKELVLDNACVLLAGRGAEQRFAGRIDGTDDGATSDLQRATAQVWSAIVEWGMDEEFGPIVLEACTSATSGWLVDEAHRRLQKILKQAVAETDRLVERYWPDITILAKVLLEKGSLSGDDVLLILPEFMAARTNLRARIEA